MKWFDKWFAKKCKWVWENHNQIMQEEILVSTTSSKQATLRNSHISKDYVDFKLWFADNGGYVIEFSGNTQFDNKVNFVSNVNIGSVLNLAPVTTLPTA